MARTPATATKAPIADGRRRRAPADGDDGNARQRLTARDWIEAALDIMVAQSVDAVRVEPLAERLGITKGSFYWHFKDRDALLTAVLDHWVERATLAIIRRVDETATTAADRLLRLLMLPFESQRAPRGAEIELAIRGWARRAPLARNAIDRVDRLRLAYFEQLFRSLGHDEAAAATRAYIAYTFLQSSPYIRSEPDSVRQQTPHILHRLLLAD